MSADRRGGSRLSGLDHPRTNLEGWTDGGRAERATGGHPGRRGVERVELEQPREADEQVVTNSNMTTSRSPKDLPAFCERIVQEFAGQPAGAASVPERRTRDLGGQMVTDLRQNGSAVDEGTERLTQALGWFSLGLSLAPIGAPERLSRQVGVDDSRTATAVLRAVGVRELLHASGLLLQHPQWVW